MGGNQAWVEAGKTSLPEIPGLRKTQTTFGCARTKIHKTSNSPCAIISVGDRPRRSNRARRHGHIPQVGGYDEGDASV